MWGSAGTTPLIPEPDNTWSWAVSYRSRPTYPRGNNHHYYWTGSVVGSRPGLDVWSREFSRHAEKQSTIPRLYSFLTSHQTVYAIPAPANNCIFNYTYKTFFAFSDLVSVPICLLYFLICAFLIMVYGPNALQQNTSQKVYNNTGSPIILPSFFWKNLFFFYDKFRSKHLSLR
jgi:hypothetical protein